MGRRLSQTRGAVSRVAKNRPTATRLLIVCGAEGTEPNYISGLNRHLRSPAVQVKVLEKGRAPAQVVKFGVKMAEIAERRGEGYDRLWCVVDVDQFDDHDAACRKAAAQSTPATHVVISNPCFELWLLLHFKDIRRALASYTDVRPHLDKQLPGYDKTVDFAARYPDAVRRAQALEPTGTEWRTNPSTAMWRLVEARGGCACCPGIHASPA